MGCLTEDAVVDFVAGQLGTEQSAIVDRHMAECAACRSWVADVAKISFEESGAKPAAEAPSPKIGDIVGRYRLLEVLGVGGMGVVYGAEDPELGRKIALKLIRADLASTSGMELTRRLRQEARAMAKISHPNVVTVHDIGTIGDHLFVAMEYVQGTTLRAWRSASPRSWREVVDVFLSAGRGLAAAHAVGLVHRDFKPENVLCGEDGRVRVTDFGLARRDLPALGDWSTPQLPPSASTPFGGIAALTTRTGQLVGTPAYMAPEQLTGDSVDARSDQFSFCVALFEALYGIRPYPAKDLRELTENVARGEVAAAPADTDVPPLLYTISSRGLRPRPEDRFPSMDAVLDELAALRPKPSSRAVASAAPAKTGGRRAILGVAAMTVVAASAVGVWLLRPTKHLGPSSNVFPRAAEAGECPRAGLFCSGHGVNGEPARLYRCEGGRIAEEKKCNVACLHIGRGAADACDGDTTSCPFNGSGVYCGTNYMSADPKILYRCAAGKVTVAQVCRTRCIEEPDRVADHCD